MCQAQIPPSIMSFMFALQLISENDHVAVFFHEKSEGEKAEDFEKDFDELSGKVEEGSGGKLALFRSSRISWIGEEFGIHRVPALVLFKVMQKWE